MTRSERTGFGPINLHKIRNYIIEFINQATWAFSRLSERSQSIVSRASWSFATCSHDSYLHVWRLFEEPVILSIEGKLLSPVMPQDLLGYAFYKKRVCSNGFQFYLKDAHVTNKAKEAQVSRIIQIKQPSQRTSDIDRTASECVHPQCVTTLFSATYCA